MIPFQYLTRHQVAEYLNRHVATVDKYAKQGINRHGTIHVLPKEKGKFKTEDVLRFKRTMRGDH